MVVCVWFAELTGAEMADLSILKMLLNLLLLFLSGDLAAAAFSAGFAAAAKRWLRSIDAPKAVMACNRTHPSNTSLAC